MIWAEHEGRAEGDVEPHFLTGNRPLAASELVGLGVNAVNNRVGGGEVGVEQRRREAELTGRAIAAAKLLSDGEFTRVVALPSGGSVESMGNTW